MIFHVVQLALSILIALESPLPVRSALYTETTREVGALRLSWGQDLDAPHLVRSGRFPALRVSDLDFHERSRQEILTQYQSNSRTHPR